MHLYQTSHLNFSFNKSYNMNFIPHLHKEIEIIYVVNGAFTLLSNFQLYHLQAGDFFIAFPNTIHEYIDNNECTCLIWIFDASILPDYSSTFRKKMPLYPVLKANQVTLDIHYALDAFQNRSGLQTESTLSKTLLSLLLHDLLDGLSLQDIGVLENYEWLMKLLIYLGEHMQDELSLDMISEEIGISKYHLSRTFKARTGYSIPTYINTVRVTQAMELLKHSDQTITEIAFSCGFESMTTFFRAFKQITGKSPKQFKTD
ncbi:MAG: AraC family transcriptional regulator [Lachnospiraceae bacterium]